MAYRIEKERTGQQAIIMDGWEKGIAPDPYSGVNRLFQVNLSTPGEVSVGYPITTSTTSGATLGVPVARSTRFFGYGSPGVPDGSAQSFAMLDSTGQVWESTSISGTWNFLSSNNTTTSASASDGVVYWLGYLFKTRNANIDYWNGSTWSNAWQTTLTGSTKHFMYVATDNVLYITNGNFIASIVASTPTAFDPTNATTYSFSTQKLEIPVTDEAISLSEIGYGSAPNTNLLIGGTQNAIYPWDKTSSSYSVPIIVAESYIKNMISANQKVFIFTGNQQGRGRIFVTNGSQAEEFFKMPDYLFGEQDPYYVWGDAIFHRNNLIWGCFVTKNSGSGVLLFSEVYAYDLQNNIFRTISELNTSATGKGNATCLISGGSLSSPGFGYIVGWDDNGSAPGIGYSGTTSGIGTSTIVTDLIPVGSFTQKGNFHEVEFKMRTALQSGESITVTPLIDGSSGTSLTFTPAGTSGSISGVAPVTFEGVQWIQFLIQLTGNSATSGARLKELRLRYRI